MNVESRVAAHNVLMCVNGSERSYMFPHKLIDELSVGSCDPRLIAEAGKLHQLRDS